MSKRFVALYKQIVPFDIPLVYQVEPICVAEATVDPTNAITIAANALTADGFAPFGEVIEHRGSERRHYVGARFASGETLTQSLWVSRLVDCSVLPITIEAMERHPHSDQAFVPLKGQPYLVVVCGSAADGGPDAASARAFVARPDQGVLYQRNVWHMGMTILEAPAEFVVTMGVTGGDGDDVFARLDRPLSIHAPDASRP